MRRNCEWRAQERAVSTRTRARGPRAPRRQRRHRWSTARAAIAQPPQTTHTRTRNRASHRARQSAPVWSPSSRPTSGVVDVKRPLPPPPPPIIARAGARAARRTAHTLKEPRGRVSRSGAHATRRGGGRQACPCCSAPVDRGDGGRHPAPTGARHRHGPLPGSRSGARVGPDWHPLTTTPGAQRPGRACSRPPCRPPRPPPQRCCCLPPPRGAAPAPLAPRGPGPRGSAHQRWSQPPPRVPRNGAGAPLAAHGADEGDVSTCAQLDPPRPTAGGRACPHCHAPPAPTARVRRHRSTARHPSRRGARRARPPAARAALPLRRTHPPDALLRLGAPRSPPTHPPPRRTAASHARRAALHSLPPTPPPLPPHPRARTILGRRARGGAQRRGAAHARHRRPECVRLAAAAPCARALHRRRGGRRRLTPGGALPCDARRGAVWRAMYAAGALGAGGPKQKQKRSAAIRRPYLGSGRTW